MRGVDQVDPEPDRRAQQLARGVEAWLAPDAGKPHGSEAEPVDAQLAPDRERAGGVRGS